MPEVAPEHDQRRVRAGRRSPPSTWSPPPRCADPPSRSRLIKSADEGHHAKAKAHKASSKPTQATSKVDAPQEVQAEEGLGRGLQMPSTLRQRVCPPQAASGGRPTVARRTSRSWPTALNGCHSPRDGTPPPPSTVALQSSRLGVTRSNSMEGASSSAPPFGPVRPTGRGRRPRRVQHGVLYNQESRVVGVLPVAGDARPSMAGDLILEPSCYPDRQRILRRRPLCSGTGARAR